GVFDLDLRVEADAIGEVVADEEDEAAQIDDRGSSALARHAARVRRRVQRQLAVAADRGAVDRGRAAEGVLDRRLARQRRRRHVALGRQLHHRAGTGSGRRGGRRRGRGGNGCGAGRRGRGGNGRGGGRHGRGGRRGGAGRHGNLRARRR